MKSPEIEKNLGTLLEKAAVGRGGKTLIHFDHEDIGFSFKQFNARVNQYANALAAEGIQQAQHVAVMLPNIPQFPIIWLALAKLGAVMVPINNRYQAEDLEYVLNDSDAVALVIDDQFVPTFQQVQARTAGVKKIFRVADGRDGFGRPLAELARQASGHFEMPDIDSQDLINIQYTSGTTGFPKGCMLPHSYWLITGLTAAMRNIRPDDVFLSVSPFYYMDPQWELIMCITAGCCMVLTRKYSPSNYMRLIHKYQATVSWAIIPTWIFKQPESVYDKDHRLRFLLVGGGFPADIHRDFERRFNVRTREAFGMTEIGSCLAVDLEDDHMSGSGTVGKPAPFREVKIVDDEGRQVPCGQVGELWVRGPGMFKGYYKKPEETAKAFAGQWFRTGDLFRMDENGYYYIVGRKKDMIRRTSDNISASEVESVLASHPKILSAAVVPVPDPERGEEVKAYIVPAEGQTPQDIAPEQIIAYCRRRIAEFKIPRYIEYRQSFPTTPTGKVAKHALTEEDVHSGIDCYDREAER